MCGSKLQGRKLQYVASLLASIFIASSSMALFWTSTAIDFLLYAKESPLDEPFEKDHINTLYILFMVGSVVGNICLSVLINHFGRRGALLAMCLPMFVSWTMILFGRNIVTISIARFIMGLTLNLPTIVAVMYISEISEAEMRGKLSVFCLLAAEIGGIITFTVGPASYHVFALIGVLIPVVAFALFWFMPETPYFYLRKMRYQEAEISLRRLRDATDISEELKQMTIAVEDSLKTSSNIATNKSYKKAFFVVFGLKTIQEFSGGHFIQSYMIQLFNIADTGLDPNMQSLVCILVPFPFILAASFLIDKFGRKPLLYTSIIGTGFAMLLESTYFFVQDSGSSMEGMRFLPVTGIFLSFIFKGIGLATIPVLIMNELFSTNVKGFASAIILVYGSILATILSYVFFDLSYKFGLQGCFLFFAICCFLGLLFTIFCVPETKGKSLAEIHKEL